MNSVHDLGCGAAGGSCRVFRQELYRCLPRRADAAFDVVDAVLCADGPVRSPPELSLIGEHRRGHGSVYAALERVGSTSHGCGRALVSVTLPRAAEGWLVLAVDITSWLRPEAHTYPQRILRHIYGRTKYTHQDDSRLSVLGRLYPWNRGVVPGPRHWMRCGWRRVTTPPLSPRTSCAP
ncbi:transposase [Nocardia sp. SC052]|uniref:transposase n=1 Tax=Nocardia sichangensis TaxID=3385975 RepID=UPI0039A355C7